MSDTRVVHVEIHGQRYAIRSELAPQYVAELAALVDEKMQLASRELTTTDTLRVAVIAALNIADELVRTRSDSRGAEGTLRARAADIERIIDAALTGAQVDAVND